MEFVRVEKCEYSAKGKLRVVFDNGVSCLLYRSEAARYDIAENALLPVNIYEDLLKEVVGKRAKKRAMHLLEQMDRTESKIREKLSASEYPEFIIDDAIDYLKEFHYLDDYRLACNYVRYHQEKLGRGQIKQKLLTKGVPMDTAELALEEEYSSDDRGKIISLLEKKHYDPSNSDSKERAKLYQFVLRRGFKSADILKVMKEYQ